MPLQEVLSNYRRKRGIPGVFQLKEDGYHELGKGGIKVGRARIEGRIDRTIRLKGMAREMQQEAPVT